MELGTFAKENAVLPWEWARIIDCPHWMLSFFFGLKELIVNNESVFKSERHGHEIMYYSHFTKPVVLQIFSSLDFGSSSPEFRLQFFGILFVLISGICRKHLRKSSTSTPMKCTPILLRDNMKVSGSPLKVF